jgi:LmbE family N-acetylglucosaminyl deacetylase
LATTEKSPLQVLVIGAHPDDCELLAGGVATLYRRGGHLVRFVSVTNGESGHQTLCGKELAAIRKLEAEAAGRVLDVQYDVLPFPDGYLEPSLTVRLALIALIREFQPDLILTHRPNDYHPDHRATSQAVCDASYLLTVPAICPEVTALAGCPVIAYLSDYFQRPYPFSPTVVIDIEPVLDTIIDALACHTSQMFDWLPYNRGVSHEVPREPDAQRQWLRKWYLDYIGPLAEHHRELVLATYGAQRGKAIRWIEAFEPCEYGAPLDDIKRHTLFPFLP